MSVAAVILGAGKGRRYRGNTPKLRAPFKGKPLVTWAVSAAVGANLDEVIVVTGAVDLMDLLPSSVTILQNEAWDMGLATSLRVALDWAQRQGHDAVVVSLGDCPLVTKEAFSLVARADSTPIAIANYPNGRGHPIRLSSQIWPTLPISGDKGAKSFITRDDNYVTLVDCPGEPVDLDTQEDFKLWS